MLKRVNKYSAVIPVSTIVRRGRMWAVACKVYPMSGPALSLTKPKLLFVRKNTLVWLNNIYRGCRLDWQCQELRGASSMVLMWTPHTRTRQNYEGCEYSQRFRAFLSFCGSIMLRRGGLIKHRGILVIGSCNLVERVDGWEFLVQQWYKYVKLNMYYK